jgi:predicted O-methyltransferase YrrM
MTAGTDIERAAAHWDSIAPLPQRARWWNWPRIVEFQNRRIVPTATTEWGDGLRAAVRSRYPERVFARAASIACGDGAKELAWIKAGLVTHFNLFEISETRIAAGAALYAAAGLSDRVTWLREDGVAALERRPAYDLVFWDNALHHMPDTPRAIRASLVGLRPGGVFVMNDFVGPSRFQWSDRELYYASAVRNGLAPRFLRDPAKAGAVLPMRQSRPSVTQMIASDPSEAADSARILPALRAMLPQPSIWLLGGTIYHLALSDVLGNFHPMHDMSLLESLLVLDEALIEMGESHYAACLAARS